jgi:hypothetical protein
VPPPLSRLLTAAVQDRRDLVLGDLPAGAVRWAVEAGLGPWLRRCAGADPAAAGSPLWPLVQGADLTARVIVGEQLDALEEILRAAHGRAPPLALLKGAALAGRAYPEPHLRLMGDLDLLAEPGSLPAVESLLAGLGYIPRSDLPPAFYAGHHHLPPLFHPGRRVWVEVHRGLVPPGGPLGAEAAFAAETVAAERRPWTFRGHPVARLSDELEVVYLAAHWASDLRPARAMTGMLDVARLLVHGPGLRWDRILAWLDRSPGAAGALYLLLTYLDRRGLAPAPGALAEVRSRQRGLGRVNLAVLHAVVDWHVVRGPSPGLPSTRTADAVWPALLGRGRPAGNLGRALWALLPFRARLARTVRRRTSG